MSHKVRIRCDNRQTLRFFDESVKLVTKLHHVDIHNHWLRQESKKGTVQLHWEPTSTGLTKALSKQKFAHFVKPLLRLLEDELKDELKANAKTTSNSKRTRIGGTL